MTSLRLTLEVLLPLKIYGKRTSFLIFAIKKHLLKNVIYENTFYYAKEIKQNNKFD